jgi:tripartite-type tricarboxylate transporter receptor subunit TctC
MIHVPYKGMGAAYTDMVGGRIQVGFPTIVSSSVHVQAGRLRALAVTTPKRVAAAPDIPTFAEAGVKGVVVVNWYGLIAPRNTPKPVIDRIAKETHAAMHSADVIKRLAADGSEPVGSSPAEFAAHLRAEHEKWSRVIKQAGIRGE